MTPKAPPSDALVFFGATGDLAYKKIFPALQAMARRGQLTFPVIGVAKSGWNAEQLIERAKNSGSTYGGLNEEAFKVLAGKLRYVDGDYNAPETFNTLKALLDAEGATRPTHYLAIPPSLFPTVIQRLADLCEQEERYKDAVGYLDQLLEIEGDDEEISKLSQRIAHLIISGVGFIDHARF